MSPKLNSTNVVFLLTACNIKRVYDKKLNYYLVSFIFWFRFCMITIPSLRGAFFIGNIRGHLSENPFCVEL